MTDYQTTILRTTKYLDALYYSLQEIETHLSGGQELTPTAESIKALRETKISFGNPQSRLTKISLEDFKRLNIPEHDPIYQQAQTRFDFYYLSLTVSFSALKEQRFSRLLCRLDFKNDYSWPIVHAMAPMQNWHGVAEWGGEGSLGIGTELGLHFALPNLLNLPNLPIAVKSLALEAQGKSFFAVLPFRFSLGRVAIAATGIDNNFAQWDIGGPEIQHQNELVFVLIFKVLKGTSTLKIDGQMQATIHKPVLQKLLQHVWHALSEDLRLPLEYDDELLLAKSEVWLLDLPV